MIILLALAAAGGGLGALAFKHGASNIEKPPPPLPGKSPPREVNDSPDPEDEERPKRKVDPATQMLADGLIDFARDWHARHPGIEDREARGREWAAAAFTKLCELETSQLLGLAAMPMELRWVGESTETPAFFAYFGSGFLSDELLLQALGAKDYETARDFFLANHDLSDCAYTSADDPNCTLAMEGLRAGVLRAAPAEGWELFMASLRESGPALDEESDMGFSATEEAEKLMEIHAFCDPVSSWQFILNCPEPAMLVSLLTGYLNVVPDRDWANSARELTKGIRETPAAADRSIYRLLAAGWAGRQPREALAWYFAETQELPPPDEDPAADAVAAETREILSTIPRLPEAVARMAREGCGDLAELVIAARPTDVRLLDTVPLLPSADTRAALLEQSSQAILEDVGPYKSCLDQEELDVAIAALSRAAAQSALPPDLMERVDAGIRTLEEKKPEARKAR